MFKLKKKEIASILLYAIPNTVLNFMIIHIINNAMAGNESYLEDYMIFVFLAIIGFAYLLNVIFQKGLNKYAFKVLYENEKKIFNQILEAPLSKLEKYGSERFYTIMQDLRTFSSLPYTVTHTITSLLMLILGVIYMFSLSIVAAAIVLTLIIGVAASYFIVLNTMTKKVTQLREYTESYYRYVDDLILGFKGLKLSWLKRNNVLLNYFGPNRTKSEKLEFKVNYVFLSINLISQYGLYFVIAVVLFVLPTFELLDLADVIAYVVVILFISGPINNLINLQQMFTNLAVADTRIKKFMGDFKDEREAFDLNDLGNVMDFESLKLEDVKFQYENEKVETNKSKSKSKKEENSIKEPSFALGPVDFEVNKGEVVFVVGGNGSGKSTFINLLTGLYDSSEGNILLNNNVLEKKETLQNLVAAVFTDNHIYANNYENYELEGNQEYKELLKLMEMDKVVEDESDKSARRKFSKGQGKRMSLIFALLEKKPILVLDEWAADQDPYFRKFFYEELIPKFRREGKTIVAVTHDDAYFHLADRIVKFDYGKIIVDQKPEKTTKVSEIVWN